MHLNRIPLTAALALAGALAAPALADVPADPPSAEPATFPQPERAAAKAVEAARDARRERRRANRHVFPVDAAPDYGSTGAEFGAARSGHMHSGQDIFAPVGTPLLAVTDSVVAETGTDGGQGNYVHLYDESEDRTYIYMHLVAPASVKAGERVEAGQRVGGVGCTGSCWGDHLHFEVRSGKGFLGEPQDPMPFLEEWASRD